MQINYDPEADAMYIQLRIGDIDDTRKISKYVYVDEDEKGQPIGLEILFASRLLAKDETIGITFNIGQLMPPAMAA